MFFLLLDEPFYGFIFIYLLYLKSWTLIFIKYSDKYSFIKYSFLSCLLKIFINFDQAFKVISQNPLRKTYIF